MGQAPITFRNNQSGKGGMPSAICIDR
ncbi:MAG TPA: hypothetical protein ENI05_02900 [Porticoccus sp.]|nr:hypothetical protein [Porticoccus sp.]